MGSPIADSLVADAAIKNGYVAGTWRTKIRRLINARIELPSLRYSKRACEKSGGRAHAKRININVLRVPYQTRAVRRFGEKRSERQKFESLPERRSREVWARRPVFIEDFCGLESQRRMLNADGMAEREELGSNILHVAPSVRVRRYPCR